VDNRAAQVIRRELDRRKKLDPPEGQKELADELGMSQSFLSRLASGEKIPKLWEDGVALERVLKLSLADFELPAEEEDPKGSAA
jgi:predicted transcriptional regulator